MSQKITNKITEQDVYDVSNRIKQPLSQDDVLYILQNYDSEEKNSQDNWSYIVEEMIYNLK